MQVRNKIKPMVSYDKLLHKNASQNLSHQRSKTSMSASQSLQSQSFNFNRIRRHKSRKAQPRQKYLAEGVDVRNMVHGASNRFINFYQNYKFSYNLFLTT